MPDMVFYQLLRNTTLYVIIIQLVFGAVPFLPVVPAARADIAFKDSCSTNDFLNMIDDHSSKSDDDLSSIENSLNGELQSCAENKINDAKLDTRIDAFNIEHLRIWHHSLIIDIWITSLC